MRARTLLPLLVLLVPFGAAGQAGAGDPGALRTRVASFLEVGRYEEAIREVRTARERHPADPAIAVLLGHVLPLVGRDAEAETLLRRALDAGARDSLEARLTLARILERRGAREEAIESYARVAEAYGAPGLSSRDLTAVGRALARLGARDPQLYHAALRAFQQATEADPADPEPRLATGELFLDRYDSREAGVSFREVLARNPRHPEALLGMARRAWFDGSSEAFRYVEQALERNPRFVPARVFLARLHLDVEEIEAGEAEARRALETDPASLEAHAVWAAARYLAGDREGFRRIERELLERSPGYAGLHLTAAELAVRNRLYAEAVELARRAIELDPEAWTAHGLLGLNLLRIGRMEEGRAALEVAFGGDPFNPWHKNTLDLLDVLAGFPEVPTDRARLVLEPDEAALLPIYMAPLVEEALDRLGARYGTLPELPLRIEVYGRHADFSVRTVGLAGLGALGVSFGSVLAMDSPSARERGTFSWASTLWHEISHAFTLKLTRHRIPRWFSEGLAVLDEHRARPAWGADPTPGFFVAVLSGRLLPIGELNRGFVRPSYPGQLQHSYLHAYLLCRMIEEERGEGALLAMLEGYRDGLDTEEVFERVLGAGPTEVDRRFRDWLERRYAAPLAALREEARRSRARESTAGEPPQAEGRGRPPIGAGAVEPRPDDFPAQLARGWRLYEEGRPAEAMPYLERAKVLFPGYAGADAPQLALAGIHAAAGETRRAAEELELLAAVAEEAWDANLRLAELREELGEEDRAAAALERALQVDPFDARVHERLARVRERQGRWEAVVRERRALVALDPVDRAGALYRLAVAEERAGRSVDARRTVLRALEIAPAYEEALEMLLRLSESGKGGGL